MTQIRWRTLAVALMVLAPTVRADEGAPKSCRSPYDDEAPLALPIANFEMHDTALCQVLDQLRDLMSVPLVVDQEAIVAKGIDLHQPITIAVQNVPLNMVLADLLYPCGLCWQVKENEVHIGPQTEEEAVGLRIGKAPIQLRPETLIAFARGKEEAAYDPTLSKADRLRVIDCAFMAYKLAQDADPACEEARCGIQALIARLSTGMYENDEPPMRSPSSGMPDEHGCGTCVEEASAPPCPSSAAKHEPSCYPDVNKCDADCTTGTCSAPKDACCRGGVWWDVFDVERSRSCCECFFIGSMLGCMLDQPLVGAYLGNC